jgi:hypothetical protein
MTIMIRPSFEAGRPLKATDLPPKKSRKYFTRGLDRIFVNEVICPSGQFAAAKSILSRALAGSGFACYNQHHIRSVAWEAAILRKPIMHGSLLNT